MQLFLGCVANLTWPQITSLYCLLTVQQIESVPSQASLTYFGYFTRVESLAVLDICLVREQPHVIYRQLVFVRRHTNGAFIRILQHLAHIQIFQALDVTCDKKRKENSFKRQYSAKSSQY